MTEIIKQSMANIWASIGDVVVPDVEKIAEGWLVEVVPRQYWNWMQNRTDTNLAYLLQHGIPEWDAITEYIANKSFVQVNGVVYKAILTGVNQNPTTATTYWTLAFATSTAALEALKATTPAADSLPYFNGTTTATTTTLTSFARTILDDTSASAVRTTIGAQAQDATLQAISDLTTATNKLPYFTGVDTATTTDLTAFGRSLIDDADATAGRATLGLNNVDNTSDANKPISTAQQTALDLKAPLVSPALTGIPTVPTAAVGTSTTQAASTAFVLNQANDTAANILMDGTQSAGTLETYARSNHRHPTDTSRAPLASPTFTGVVTAPSFVGPLTGNASTATTLQTGRTIALTGDVTATGVSFNGSSNISLTTSIPDTGWLTPTLVNGFTQNATFPLRYRKIGNVVFLKGIVEFTSPPAIGVTVCTLPVGYRPSAGETHFGLWITGADFTCALRSIGVATTGVVSLVFSYQLTTVTPSGAGNISFNTSFPAA